MSEMALETVIASDVSKTAEDASLDPELLIKHPLQSKWAFWYYKPDRAKSWEDNLSRVSDFDTVEDFWALFNHIKPPSEVMPGSDYNLFKDGIKPMWEDPRNRQGGRWLINLDKRQKGPEIDRMWLELVLCTIGEAYDECSDDICGVVINVRPKADKIAIWIANSSNKDVVLKIGHRIKEFLELPLKVNIFYENHSDTAVKSGSQAKHLFQI